MNGLNRCFAGAVTPGQGFGIELVTTFVLVTTVLAITDDRRGDLVRHFICSYLT